MTSKAQERANRLFKWKQDGVKALSEHEASEQATRLLTAKLRAERLAREAMSKRDQKRSTKAQAKNHRCATRPLVKLNPHKRVEHSAKE